MSKVYPACPHKTYVIAFVLLIGKQQFFSYTWVLIPVSKTAIVGQPCTIAPLVDAHALLSYQSASAIDAGDQNGDTALHVAAKYGHVNVLELMLSRGADITARNKQMLTCLDVAISCSMENVAEVILGNPK